ncbi:MAG TPA: YihY/virulence factor BrkB family protein [Gemmatimonadales bacterium]|nr:YihY/virulence factor BrkB family protein [Gemmatimonadales bacterium]
MKGAPLRAWYRSPGGFLKRTLQAADENNIPFLASALTFDALLAAVPFVLLLLIGLTHLAQALQGGVDLGGADPTALFHRFLPPHSRDPGSDPFRLFEGLLLRITRNRGELSLVAAPAFVWFSTRLFAGIRTALNEVYDVAARPQPRRNFVLLYLRGKLRDVLMVLATLVLFLANTVMTAGLALLQARGATSLPELRFFLSTAGRILAELLAFAFQVSLFLLVYRHASIRRLPWKTALLAALFASFAFELAKRLYGWYLANVASLQGPAGDANIGAAVLFVLWVYYTALVFLLGGVVAETWELRRMQTRQRAILG